MRVLHITPFFEPGWSYGGVVRATGALTRALARRGHEVTVVTARLSSAHPAEEHREGVSIVRLPGPDILTRRLVPFGRGLGRLLGTLGPRADLAHIHGHRNGLALVAARALQRQGRPWVLQPHGTYPTHGRLTLIKDCLDLLAGRRVVVGASRLLAVSQAEAADLPGRAEIIPNGVEPLAPANAPRPESRPRPLPRRLLFVGNDSPQKRGRSLAGLLEALPDVGLSLVGPCRGLALKLGRFGDRVSAKGVLGAPDLAQAYADSAVLIHPAIDEAFGLAPFEAALHGTPAVVAGGHGCGEWFGRAGGRVVPPDDPERLLVTTRQLLEDPAVARAEADRVADFARRELTWERAAAAMEAVYERVLSSAQRGVA